MSYGAKSLSLGLYCIAVFAWGMNIWGGWAERAAARAYKKPEPWWGFWSYRSNSEESLTRVLKWASAGGIIIFTILEILILMFGN